MIEDVDTRRRELATIHLGAKAIGMERDAYEDLLFTIARVRSAAQLDSAGRKRVIEHMRKCGFKAVHKREKPVTGWEWVNNAAGERQPLLRKIAVMLRESDREKSYADGIAKKMFGILVVEFCAPDQLRKIVSALVYDTNRNSRTTTHEQRTTNNEQRHLK